MKGFMNMKFLYTASQKAGPAAHKFGHLETYFYISDLLGGLSAATGADAGRPHTLEYSKQQ